MQDLLDRPVAAIEVVGKESMAAQTIAQKSSNRIPNWLVVAAAAIGVGVAKAALDARAHARNAQLDAELREKLSATFNSPEDFLNA
jgi:hypothetical protein